MSAASKHAFRAGMLALVAILTAPAAGQTAATPPAAPPVPPNQIPPAAARDPQNGSRVEAPSEAVSGKPTPTTDPPTGYGR